MDFASDFDELAEGLWSLDSDEQLDCIEALARSGSSRAVSALQDASPDMPEVKLALLRALQMIDSTQAWDAFDFRWTIEDDKDVRLAGLSFYQTASPERLLAAAKAATVDDDPFVREAAVETLERSFGSAAVQDLTLIAAADDDAGVRSAAILALWRIGGAEATEELRVVASTDDEKRVQRLARHLLKRLERSTDEPSSSDPEVGASRDLIAHGQVPPKPKQIRFSAPPVWPAPPDGWEPPPGWMPPREWPAAPIGWAYWIAAD